MPSTALELFVGWHAVEPGPVPLSPLYDRPPVVRDPRDLPAAHRQWRAQVETDQRRLAAQHASQSGSRWVRPVTLMCSPSTGEPRHVGNLVASVALCAATAHFARVRMVNLTQTDAFGVLHRAARAGRLISVRSDTVSATSSTVDLFGRLAPLDLASLVVNVVRTSDAQGRRPDAAIADTALRSLIPVALQPWLLRLPGLLAVRGAIWVARHAITKII